MAVLPKIRGWLVRYFTFTRSERNGAVMLSAILAGLLVLPWLYETVRGPRSFEVCPDFYEMVAAFYGWPDTTKTVGGNGYLAGSRREAAEGLYYGAESDSEGRVANSDNNSPGILHDTAEGHDTRAGNGAGAGSLADGAPDFSTGMAGRRNRTPDEGQLLSGRGAASPVSLVVELNSADTACLMSVRGLGPVLSRRIIRYRDLLGGYYCTGQLLEVYGIDTARFLQINPYLAADRGLVSKLNLAGGGFSDLLRHPYLSYEQVAWIFRFRESGKIISADDLMVSPLFNAQETGRLAPYLEGYE